MHVVGHDFQGDDFSPIFFSGLSNQRFTAFCNRTNQARCADTWASTRNDICWNTPHYCSICTLLVPCLNLFGKYQSKYLDQSKCQPTLVRDASSIEVAFLGGACT